MLALSIIIRDADQTLNTSVEIRAPVNPKSYAPAVFPTPSEPDFVL